MSKVVIAGGGAAGMMAAILAGESGKEVVLVEKNDRLGKKLFITGKGRCNLTNSCEAEDFFQAVTTNSKFMYSAFYDFDNKNTVDFFHKLGLATKVERGGRIFPASNHSSDVIGVLKTKLYRCSRIQVLLNRSVTKILTATDNSSGVLGVTGAALSDGTIIECDKVIIATGGISYPLTGSTGDGYNFARKLGHTIKEPMPSLVPFHLQEAFCREIMGLSLKNVRLVIGTGKKKIFDEQGELLFTHFGISGPLVIKASAYMHKYLDKPVSMYIDLKPALDEAELDARILRDFAKFANKDFRNSLSELLPVKMINPIIEKSGIDPFKKVHSVSKEERRRLIQAIKQFDVTFMGLRGFDEAIITKGGVDVKEVNPSTMESKLVKGLYFAGEVLDVDAVTGGYNLQIAWSTGHLAGKAVSE